MNKTLLGSVLGLAVVFTAVAPAFAHKNNDRDDDKKMPRVSVAPVVLTVEQKTCMINAVDKRETALITALDKFHASTKTVLEVRKEALKKAWNLSDEKERQTAIKAAWNTFKESIKKAGKELKEARKSAWRQYEVDRKACNVSAWDIRVKDFHQFHIW
ncbi:MAG: hypothetical protein Q7S32_04540 [bacterium]|nr:hypothetical protein [bacterium]